MNQTRQGRRPIPKGRLVEFVRLIFVVLFGVSVWLPQYLMTKDPMQRRTGTIMAVVMLYIAFIYPAGVLIYWVTSSGWQVVQQVLMQRKLGRAKGAEA